MSEEHVEVVRRVYDAVARRDTAGVLALYHPDIEWDGSRHAQWGLLGRSVFRGHDGLRAFFRQRHEAWETIEDDCQEIFAVGDHVVSVVVVRARGRASGIEVEMETAGVWTVSDDQVRRVAWYPRREDAIEAAEGAEQRMPGEGLEPR